MFIAEDSQKTGIACMLYNMVDDNAKIKDVQKKFPKGTVFGIKQPYLKQGTRNKKQIALRNDNPENIIFKIENDNDPLSLKEKGNEFFKNKEFSQALKYYRKALETTKD